MQAPQLIYFLGSFILICYWVNKAENKWFLFAILFWLFSTPILGDEYFPISIHFAGIDFQPSRILFLFFSGMLCLFIIQAKVAGRSIFEYALHRFRFYELWMVIYICIAIVIILFNYPEIGVRAVVVNIAKLLTFPLVYFFARECVSRKDFHLLAVAIVTFAILSSLAGIYQFFGDASFFRLGVSRPAFAAYIRGNGFFTSEYDQGIFLTIALAVGMITIQNRWAKALMIAILPLGVFFTMHRASWAILAIAFGMVIIREFRNTYLWIILSATVATVAVFIVLNMPLQQDNLGNFVKQMINLRVGDNTWDVRLNYNQFAIHMLQKYPLGIGDYASDVYLREAYKQSMDFFQGAPLIIHNGFLSAGVIYGVAGMIAFTLFTLTTLLHYLQEELLSTNIGFMIVSVMVSFILINTTQDFSYLGNQICIFLGLLIGAALSLDSFPMPVQKPLTIGQLRQTV